VRRGFKCKKDLLEELKQNYDNIVADRYGDNFLEALKNFDALAENSLRTILEKYYPIQRSRDQAWKTCKGSLYEYAVFRCIQRIVESNAVLKNRIMAIMGDEASSSHRDQIIIRNWNEIIPDIDILLIDRKTNSVITIISCKTSLRERLTETAFWKRELEKARDMTDVKLIFVTTDKDNELRTETNRYILLHVIDYTFITNLEKYNELINTYKRKYGDRDDFEQLLERIKSIDEMKTFLMQLLEIKDD